ncbi:uncharacterized protein EI90DRAFT_3081978 [Cantharellus anzutake]|uniref:uncharacterized protein n=1 Tax=Cantharellus anzutake TaxID=1750568 RepID=UPI001907933C|nr:uncharacterized protein EI90DRAFT_3081978 [Cantharellus anzutake]KAF8319524.1 hypothetical protein EI90DRAFT_3081978 [Cantharellus anzutake]
MFKGAALFLLLLFTASIFAFPFPQRQVLRRLAPQLRDPVHGETNAKRLARGLPLLPPARRWDIEASRTETAKRAEGSDTYVWSGRIQVNSANNGSLLGYLALSSGSTGNRYTVGGEGDHFSASFHQNGISHSASFRSGTKTLSAYPYLAGLIDPGVELGKGKGNYAILGSSVQTQANDTPKSGGAVSVDNKHYETAIWDYDPTTHNITANWVDSNHTSLTVSFVWEYWKDQVIYLTINPSGILATYRYDVTLSAYGYTFRH